MTEEINNAEEKINIFSEEKNPFSIRYSIFIDCRPYYERGEQKKEEELK